MTKICALTVFLFLWPTMGSAAAGQAILWIPAQAAGMEEIIAILEENENSRLTAAFTSLPEGLADRLKKLMKDGRLELALRPAGDPPLPLLYYPGLETVKWEGKSSTAAVAGYNRQFLMFRLTRARETAALNFEKIPSGLVVPPGGVVEDFFPLARAIGIKWLACGPLASTAAAVFEAGGVTAVPFVKYPGGAPDARALPFIIFDETSAEDPAALRAVLAGELRGGTLGENLTVSEALKTAVRAAASPADITGMSTPWSGDYTHWASAPPQQAALAALAKTRSDLMLYLNECDGNYSAAKPAFDEYFAAEEGQRILRLASANLETRSEAERGIRGALANSYRSMKKTPARWVFSAPGDETPIPESAERLYILSGPGGFEIKNISRKPELPAPAPELPESADPDKIWKLDRFKVEILPKTVIFRFTPLEVDNGKGEGSGFSHTAFDLYIDINRRPRSGRSRPLGGRPFKFSPDSAWEYAIEINPGEAVLYKASIKGTVIAARFQPKLEDGAVTVSVPRAALKGDPRLWGYAALMLAPGSAKNFTVTDYIAANISRGYIHALRPGRK